jgi:hypothetical protein
MLIYDIKPLVWRRKTGCHRAEAHPDFRYFVTSVKNKRKLVLMKESGHTIALSTHKTVWEAKEAAFTHWKSEEGIGKYLEAFPVKVSLV